VATFLESRWGRHDLYRCESVQQRRRRRRFPAHVLPGRVPQEDGPDEPPQHDAPFEAGSAGPASTLRPLCQGHAQLLDIGLRGPRRAEPRVELDNPVCRCLMAGATVSAGTLTLARFFGRTAVTAKARSRAPQNASGRCLLSGGMLVWPTCGGHFEAFASARIRWRSPLRVC
jgi:hypothetical protein